MSNCIGCNSLRRECLKDCPLEPAFKDHTAKNVIPIKKVFNMDTIYDELFQLMDPVDADNRKAYVTSLVFESSWWAIDKLRGPQHVVELDKKDFDKAMKGWDDKIQSVEDELELAKAERYKLMHLIDRHGGQSPSAGQSPSGGQSPSAGQCSSAGQSSES